MKKALLFLFPAALITSCGTSTPSIDPTTATIQKSPTTLRLSGQLSGQTFQGNMVSLSVQPGALATKAEVTITQLAAGKAPAIPPVNTVNSSYIMGETPGAKLVSAWRVQVKAPTFQQGAKLSIEPPAAMQSQSNGERDVTEIFLHDNVRGTDALVGTYRGDVPLDITDFADRVNEELGQEVDFTYTAYRSTWANYVKACQKQQGDTELGYCSFRNKEVTIKKLAAQGVYRSMRALSWNVGNVAMTCDSYKYKVCYQATERRISDQILNLEQSGRFDFIFLQEMWHGNCDAAGIGTSWWSSWVNPRLCDDPTRGTPSINRILGSRYNSTCTQPAYDPSKGFTNGFECVAVDQNKYYYQNLAALGNAQGYHPQCPSKPIDSVDTGFQVVQVGLYGSSTPLMLINTHLAGTTSSPCRASQIEQLAYELRLRGKPYHLMAGDFNTEPYNDSTEGGGAFRYHFYTPMQTQAVDPVSGLLDAGNQPTAYYVWGSPSLDHVLSNAFNGSCGSGYDFDGTDHTWTVCELNSSVF